MAKLLVMKKIFTKIFCGIASLFLGFVNGLWGGGGGMLCVPLLEKGLKLETKKAHATAIPIILPITIASASVYVCNGFFDFSKTLFVSIGVIIGGVIGSFLLKKLPEFIIQILFSALMIFAGVKMIFS